MLVGCAGIALVSERVKGDWSGCLTKRLEKWMPSLSGERSLGA